MIKNIIMVGLSVLLASCSTYEYHETRANKLNRVDAMQSIEVNEDTLIDVGLVLLEDGVDLSDDESIAYANVRRSEAVWFSGQLKDTLERSNAWGIVRTLPSKNTIFDLTVYGKIIESNGESLLLDITAVDASGRQWLSKEYFKRVSQYVYNPEIELNRDPFQNLFNDIANDLLAFKNTLSDQQLVVIREIARLRFAKDFAPQVFADYIEQKNNGSYSLRRIPAETDPMLQRVESIRARNDLFLDVIQDYYRVFNNNMSVPYEEWRKLSYKEVLYERQLAKQAKQQRIAGTAIIVAGVLSATGNNSAYTRAAGHIGIGAGAEIFRKSYQTETDASMHGEALREFGESLEIELEPSVIDLQERSVTLTGTVEEQFKEWRQILQKMFDTEQSILSSPSLPQEQREQQNQQL